MTKKKKKKGSPKYELDPRIFSPDPRSLNIIGQLIYVVRCFERGLSEKDIVSLYMDKSWANVVINLVIATDLIRRDIDSGKWKRTEKATRLIAQKGKTAGYSENTGLE